MAARVAVRRRAPSASAMAVYNAIYRSVMNKVADPRCGRWTKVRGVWGAKSWRKYKCQA